MSKRILVTGGAGFIGCALSQLLTPQADSWTVLDSLHPQVHPSGGRPALLADENCHVHHYSKTEVREGRKLGHATWVGASPL